MQDNEDLPEPDIPATPYVTQSSRSQFVEHEEVLHLLSSPTTHIQRLVSIIEKYQPQSYLLDPYLEPLIDALFQQYNKAIRATHTILLSHIKLLLSELQILPSQNANIDLEIPPVFQLEGVGGSPGNKSHVDLLDKYHEYSSAHQVDLYNEATTLFETVGSCSQFLYSLSKVRGYKVIAKHLPNTPDMLEHVVTLLCCFNNAFIVKLVLASRLKEGKLGGQEGHVVVLEGHHEFNDINGHANTPINSSIGIYTRVYRSFQLYLDLYQRHGSWHVNYSLLSLLSVLILTPFTFTSLESIGTAPSAALPSPVLQTTSNPSSVQLMAGTVLGHFFSRPDTSGLSQNHHNGEMSTSHALTPLHSFIMWVRNTLQTESLETPLTSWHTLCMSATTSSTSGSYASHGICATLKSLSIVLKRLEITSSPRSRSLLRHISAILLPILVDSPIAILFPEYSQSHHHDKHLRPTSDDKHGDQVATGTSQTGMQIATPSKLSHLLRLVSPSARETSLALLSRRSSVAVDDGTFRHSRPEAISQTEPLPALQWASSHQSILTQRLWTKVLARVGLPIAKAVAHGHEQCKARSGTTSSAQLLLLTQQLDNIIHLLTHNMQHDSWDVRWAAAKAVASILRTLPSTVLVHLRASDPTTLARPYHLHPHLGELVSQASSPTGGGISARDHMTEYLVGQMKFALTVHQFNLLSGLLLAMGELLRRKSLGLQFIVPVLTTAMVACVLSSSRESRAGSQSVREAACFVLYCCCRGNSFSELAEAVAVYNDHEGSWSPQSLQSRTLVSTTQQPCCSSSLTDLDVSYSKSQDAPPRVLPPVTSIHNIVHTVFDVLIIVCMTDPERCVRESASAALQEFVGRYYQSITTDPSIHQSQRELLSRNGQYIQSFLPGSPLSMSAAETSDTDEDGLSLTHSMHLFITSLRSKLFMGHLTSSRGAYLKQLETIISLLLFFPIPTLHHATFDAYTQFGVPFVDHEPREPLAITHFHTSALNLISTLDFSTISTLHTLVAQPPMQLTSLDTSYKPLIPAFTRALKHVTEASPHYYPILLFIYSYNSINSDNDVHKAICHHATRAAHIALLSCSRTDKPWVPEAACDGNQFTTILFDFFTPAVMSVLERSSKVLSEASLVMTIHHLGVYATALEMAVAQIGTDSYPLPLLAAFGSMLSPLAGTILKMAAARLTSHGVAARQAVLRCVYFNTMLYITLHRLPCTKAIATRTGVDPHLAQPDAICGHKQLRLLAYCDFISLYNAHLQLYLVLCNAAIAHHHTEVQAYGCFTLAHILASIHEIYCHHEYVFPLQQSLHLQLGGAPTQQQQLTLNSVIPHHTIADHLWAILCYVFSRILPHVGRIIPTSPPPPPPGSSSPESAVLHPTQVSRWFSAVEAKLPLLVQPSAGGALAPSAVPMGRCPFAMPEHRMPQEVHTSSPTPYFLFENTIINQGNPTSAGAVAQWMLTHAGPEPHRKVRNYYTNPTASRSSSVRVGTLSGGTQPSGSAAAVEHPCDVQGALRLFLTLPQSLIEEMVSLSPPTWLKSLKLQLAGCGDDSALGWFRGLSHPQQFLSIQLLTTLYLVHPGVIQCTVTRILAVQVLARHYRQVQTAATVDRLAWLHVNLCWHLRRASVIPPLLQQQHPSPPPKGPQLPTQYPPPLFLSILLSPSCGSLEPSPQQQSEQTSLHTPPINLPLASLVQASVEWISPSLFTLPSRNVQCTAMAALLLLLLEQHIGLYTALVLPTMGTSCGAFTSHSQDAVLESIWSLAWFHIYLWRVAVIHISSRDQRVSHLAFITCGIMAILQHHRVIPSYLWAFQSRPYAGHRGTSTTSSSPSGIHPSHLHAWYCNAIEVPLRDLTDHFLCYIAQSYHVQSTYQHPTEASTEVTVQHSSPPRLCDTTTHLATFLFSSAIAVLSESCYLEYSTYRAFLMALCESPIQKDPQHSHDSITAQTPHHHQCGDQWIRIIDRQQELDIQHLAAFVQWAMRDGVPRRSSNQGPTSAPLTTAVTATRAEPLHAPASPDMGMLASISDMGGFSFFRSLTLSIPTAMNSSHLARHMCLPLGEATSEASVTHFDHVEVNNSSSGQQAPLGLSKQIETSHNSSAMEMSTPTPATSPLSSLLQPMQNTNTQQTLIAEHAYMTYLSLIAHRSIPVPLRCACFLGLLVSGHLDVTSFSQEKPLSPPHVTSTPSHDPCDLNSIPPHMYTPSRMIPLSLHPHSFVIPRIGLSPPSLLGQVLFSLSHQGVKTYHSYSDTKILGDCTADHPLLGVVEFVTTYHMMMSNALAYPIVSCLESFSLIGSGYLFCLVCMYGILHRRLYKSVESVVSQSLRHDVLLGGNNLCSDAMDQDTGPVLSHGLSDMLSRGALVFLNLIHRLQQPAVSSQLFSKNKASSTRPSKLVAAVLSLIYDFFGLLCVYHSMFIEEYRTRHASQQAQVAAITITASQQDPSLPSIYLSVLEFHLDHLDSIGDIPHTALARLPVLLRVYPPPCVSHDLAAQWGVCVQGFEATFSVPHQQEASSTTSSPVVRRALQISLQRLRQVVNGNTLGSSLHS